MRYAILHGTIVGPIWQPAIIGYRYVTARIERSDATTFTRGGPYPSLRDAMLALTGDGDFRACGFIPGETWLEVVEQTGPTKRSRVRPVLFGCWDTEDFLADPEWVEEYNNMDVGN